VVQLLPIPREEQITSLLAVSGLLKTDVQLLMLDQCGFIKAHPPSAFGQIRANGLIAISPVKRRQPAAVSLAVPATAC